MNSPAGGTSQDGNDSVHVVDCMYAGTLPSGQPITEREAMDWLDEGPKSRSFAMMQGSISRFNNERGADRWES